MAVLVCALVKNKDYFEREKEKKGLDNYIHDRK